MPRANHRAKSMTRRVSAFDRRSQKGRSLGQMRVIEDRPYASKPLEFALLQEAALCLAAHRSQKPERRMKLHARVRVVLNLRYEVANLRSAGEKAVSNLLETWPEGGDPARSSAARAGSNARSTLAARRVARQLGTIPKSRKPAATESLSSSNERRVAIRSRSRPSSVSSQTRAVGPPIRSARTLETGQRGPSQTLRRRCVRAALLSTVTGTPQRRWESDARSLGGNAKPSSELGAHEGGGQPYEEKGAATACSRRRCQATKAGARATPSSSLVQQLEAAGVRRLCRVGTLPATTAAALARISRQSLFPHEPRCLVDAIRPAQRAFVPSETASAAAAIRKSDSGSFCRSVLASQRPAQSRNPIHPTSSVRLVREPEWARVLRRS